MQTQLLAGDIFRRAAASRPGRTAVVLGEDSLTFDELHRGATAMADGLRRAGITPGDHVCTWSTTSLDLVVLHAATTLLGAAFLPVDPATPTPRMLALLERFDPALVVADPEHDAELAQAHGGSTPRTTFGGLRSDGRATDGDGTDVGGRGTEASESGRAGGFSDETAQAVFLTSGSTGEPKGVVLSQRTQWLRSYCGAIPELRGATVSMFPLFHMAGWIVAMQCWQSRSTVVLVERADAESILGAVERHRAERLYAIPAVWRRLLDADPDGERGASLRVIDTGTSATPPALLAELEQRYPLARRRVFYGSTEAGPVLMLDSDEIDSRAGAVGRPQPGVEVRTTAESELEVRGVHLFSGYLDGEGRIEPGLSEDGWYRTGDLAEVDDDGVWWIVGRVRQVIRTGGETVAPTEVESVLDGIDGISESAVIGMPHPDWGEVVVAVVVPAGASTGRDTLIARMTEACEAALTPPKRPRRHVFADAIPRTSATGQIRRALLAERIATGELGTVEDLPRGGDRSGLGDREQR